MTASLLAALLLATPATHTAGQGPLTRASMDVVVDPVAHTASVSLEYVIATTPGTDSVPLAAILFGDVRLTAVRAMVDGRPVQLTGLDNGSPRIAGSIALPPTTEPERTFVLRYDVLDIAGNDLVRIPVLAVLRPATDALPGTFIAHVDLPADWYASDAMPAGLRETATPTGSRRYEVGLQVVPAMLAFRLATSQPSFFGPGLLLNAGVLLFLALAGWTGWRRFMAGG